MKRRTRKFTKRDYSDHILYISNVPNDMDINEFFMTYGKYGEIQRIKLLKQYYSSEKYTDLDEIEYFGGAAVLQYVDKESRVKCLEDQKDHPFIINENVLFNETDNKNITNYFKRCGFLFFTSPYITIGKINQVFRYNDESSDYQSKSNSIQNIEILYPVEFHKPGMAIIEFSDEEMRNKAYDDFTIIQSIIENESNTKPSEKLNQTTTDYQPIFIKEQAKLEDKKSSSKKEMNFDINFIIKHVLNGREEFSFCLPSPELEEMNFKSTQEKSDDDDDVDEDEEELIPSIIYHPDRKLCNNPVQFQRWFDFEIEFRDISYKVNSLLASQFSQTIKDQLSVNQISTKNPQIGGLNRFFYSMEVDVEGDFQLVVDSLMGQQIIINPDNAIFLFLCSRELKMSQLEEAARQLVSDLTNFEMVIQFASQLWNYKNKNKMFNNYVSYYDEKDDLVKFYVDFFSLNFFKICDLSSFKSLPIDLICKTLDKLVYEKESKDESENDKLLSNWILQFFEKNDSSRVRLIPYMSKFLKQFNRSQLTSILSKPGANMNSLRDSISQLISQMNRSKNNISSKLSSSSKMNEKFSSSSNKNNDNNNNNNDAGDDDDDLAPIFGLEESHDCVYDENSPTTTGIFAYIKQKFGSVSETVDITSPDCFSCIVDPEALPNQYYCSPSFENMWIQFDFSKHPFIIQAYTIKSKDQDNCPHLRNWVIEGSNSSGPNSDWVELDIVKDSTFLLKSPHCYTYMLKNEIKESYRYIRLRQIKQKNNATEQLLLKTIEFYGTLINQDKNDIGTLYSRGKEWFGIFKYLTKKYRQNPANKEVIITSAADASNLVNPEWSNSHKMWKSADVSDPYVKFNFNGKMAQEIGSKEIKVSVDKYLLKTAMAPSYPRSWIIEGSNDGVNWTCIDEVKNNTQMIGIWKSCVFTCSNKKTASMPFSQIRIKMIGVNTKNTNFFYLSYVELYGKVITG